MLASICGRLNRFSRQFSGIPSTFKELVQVGDKFEINVKQMPELNAGEMLVRIDAAGLGGIGDGAGEIVDRGDHAYKYPVGTRVFLTGSITNTLAEYAICGEPQVHKLHESVSKKQGACVNTPYFTAYRAMAWGMARTQESILIHNPSTPLGLACVEFAIGHNMLTLCVADSEEEKQKLEELGAHFVALKSDKDFPSKIREATQGLGVECILDCRMQENMNENLQMAAHRGRLVAVAPIKETEFKFDASLFMEKEVAFIGCDAANFDDYEFNETMKHIVMCIDKGYINPCVGKSMTFEDILANGLVVDEFGFPVLLPHGEFTEELKERVIEETPDEMMM
eukprot:TRINITY_DN10203_c0_g1_i2.p1 TRINITY_DN10203_c0_g1~~TRINITY_DN10203_c0_g1_i2.p1  ORF type:complete len:339 (+),score=102.77 TRINITY_DN10203_c0_g1_i2:27-1043(+)